PRALMAASKRREAAAVDIQNLTRDIRGRLGTQKYGRAAEIIQLAEAPLRNLMQHQALPVLVLIEGLRQLGSKVSRSNAVDPDTPRSPLGRERARQAGEPRF